jgi:deoxyribose-phosphate aldolase
MTEAVTLRELAKMIDHSLLHPTMTDADLEAGCRLALRYDVATACVKPYAVRQAVELLNGSDVAVCAVVAFPHGNSLTAIKVAETRAATLDGAAEIDVVLNIGQVLGENWAYVTSELSAVNAAAIESGAILKVIFENDYLQDEHIARLCQVCSDIGAAFVKTSTGYGFVKQPDGSYNYRGATDAHLKLMRSNSPARVQIKAAGGVRSLDDLLRVRGLGVTRIGATATAAILDEARARGYD